MTQNIKAIELLTQKDIQERFGSPMPVHSDGKPLATLVFDRPCVYTSLDLQELYQIIKIWIKAEEMRYPQSPRCKGRYMLLGEIMKLFNEDGTN